MRLKVILKAVQEAAIAGLEQRQAPEASIEQIARVHPEPYPSRILESVPERGYVQIDADTVISPASGEAALRAAAKANLLRTVLWFGLLSVVLSVVWAMTNFGGYFWPVWPILGFMLAISWQIFSLYYGPAHSDDDRPRDR